MRNFGENDSFADTKMIKCVMDNFTLEDAIKEEINEC